MFSWFKKHFIPHEGNNHRPHILRNESTRNIVAIILILEIFTFLIPTITRINTTGGIAAVLPGVLSSLTNDERQSQDLPTLSVSPLLNEAAQMKAEDMAAKGYFAHTSPEGKTPWYWLEKVGYNYQYAGENLAINFSDSKDVTDAWMASPAHKANIVKGNYTEIGTGVADGMYEGQETVFVAQEFANPLPFSDKSQTQAKPVKAVAASGKITSTIPLAKSDYVLGAETVANSANIQSAKATPIKQPTFWQKLISSPRHTTNIFLYIIFGIVAISLLLYIFIKMKNHHIDLITNGLIVLALIGALFISNNYLSHKNTAISDSLDYSIKI